MTFEIDPTLVADAIREGRKLTVEIRQFGGRLYPKVKLGQPSPYTRKADTVAMPEPEQVRRAVGRG